MKKRMFLIPCLALSVCVVNTSCMGSFGLLNKFSSWNQRATGNKFVNGFIGILLSPVYGFCFAADWFVFNTIEFWTGSQLIAANTTQRVVGSNGEVYLVKCDKEGYTITNETRQDSMQLAFDEKTNEWSSIYNGETRKLFRINEASNTLTVYTPQGEQVEVSNNEAGMKELEALLTQVPMKAE